MAHGHVPLLESASLRIEAGERVCVIGRNGAGKSTLLQLIAGRQAPDRGPANFRQRDLLGQGRQGCLSPLLKFAQEMNGQEAHLL